MGEGGRGPPETEGGRRYACGPGATTAPPFLFLSPASTRRLPSSTPETATLHTLTSSPHSYLNTATTHKRIKFLTYSDTCRFPGRHEENTNEAITAPLICRHQAGRGRLSRVLFLMDAHIWPPRLRVFYLFSVHYRHYYYYHYYYL